MDIVTHTMTGTILASPFFQTAPLTASCFILGSAIPDLDVLSRLGGKTTFLRRVANALCQTRLGKTPDAAEARLGVVDRTRVGPGPSVVCAVLGRVVVTDDLTQPFEVGWRG